MKIVDHSLLFNMMGPNNMTVTQIRYYAPLYSRWHNSNGKTCSIFILSYTFLHFSYVTE